MLKIKSPFKAAIISFISGTILSLTFWQYDIYNRKLSVSKDFHQEVELRYSIISDEIQQLENDLEQIGKLFSSLETVSINEFRLFADGYINSKPELVALDWVPQIKAADREDFENKIGNQILELDANSKLTKRTNSDSYYPVMYSISRAKVSDITGFDHASISARKNAINRSIASKRTEGILTDYIVRLPAVSEKINFFILFKPVYFKNLEASSTEVKGFIIGSYCAKQLLTVIKNKISSSDIDFAFINNFADNDSNTNTYNSEQIADNHYAYLSQIKELKIGNKILKLRFTSNQDFLDQRFNSNSLDFLVIPLILTLIISVIFYLFSKKNYQLENARSLANQKSLELKAAYSAKADFLADVSHEIRSPLTSIIGYSEILLNKNLSSEEKQSSLSAVYRTSRYLLSLVSHILDMSKFEAGYSDPEVTCQSLRTLTESISILIERKASDKKLNFDIEYIYPLPEFFSTDHTKLKQILVNLLDNAIKFTHSGGVKLIISYDRSDNNLIFGVSDTGIGITEEQKKKLFSSFSQAEAFTSQIYGGSGLGLSISKKLAQILGGNIEVKSSTGQGSLFTLSLPVPEIKDTDLVYKQNSITNYNDENYSEINNQTEFNGKLLLVDDSIENQKYLSMLFTKMGFKITVVGDGSDAITAAQSYNFNLILMDIQMQNIGGLEACKILRQNGVSTPIIAISADTRKEVIEQIFNAGFNNYISKPFSNEAINKILKTVVDFQDPLLVEDEGKNTEYEKDKAEFISGFSEQIKLLEDACTAGNFALLMASSHKLAGAAAFAYTAVYETLMQINLAASDRNSERVKAALERLKAMHYSHIQ